MKKLVLAAAVLSLSTVCLANSLSSMNSTQAKKTIADKTITTVSTVTLNDKLVDNRFTGYFNKDGKMEGKLSNPPSDGTPQTDKGTWKVVKNGQICVTWQNWTNGKPRCVSFFKLNNAILVIGPENKFETLILNSDIQDGNKLPT